MSDNAVLFVVGIALIFLICLLTRWVNKKEEKGPASASTADTPTAAGTAPTVKVHTGAGTSGTYTSAGSRPYTEPESLDSIYARNNGKRLCPYCETINAAMAGVCCACGNNLPERR